MTTTLPRLVVCAAIRHRYSGRVICAPRHCHCFRALGEPGLKGSCSYWEQGFVDNRNEFMSRAEAMGVAEQSCQLRRSTGPGKELYSEDLY